MTREKELASALLWLRNHYDCSVPDDHLLKKQVMERIDRVIDTNPPGISDLFEWRIQCLRGEPSSRSQVDGGV
jgi:hypothetical protein